MQRRKDLFDGALANEDVLAVLARDHDRQSAAREVEGNFIELCVAVADVQRLLEFDMRQDRPVQQVLQARLEVAVQIRVLQHLVRSRSP